MAMGLVDLPVGVWDLGPRPREPMAKKSVMKRYFCQQTNSYLPHFQAQAYGQEQRYQEIFVSANKQLHTSTYLIFKPRSMATKSVIKRYSSFLSKRIVTYLNLPHFQAQTCGPEKCYQEIFSSANKQINYIPQLTSFSSLGLWPRKVLSRNISLSKRIVTYLNLNIPQVNSFLSLFSGIPICIFKQCQVVCSTMLPFLDNKFFFYNKML